MDEGGTGFGVVTELGAKGFGAATGFSRVIGFGIATLETEKAGITVRLQVLTTRCIR